MQVYTLGKIYLCMMAPKAGDPKISRPILSQIIVI